MNNSGSSKSVMTNKNEDNTKLLEQDVDGESLYINPLNSTPFIKGDTKTILGLTVDFEFNKSYVIIKPIIYDYLTLLTNSVSEIQTNPIDTTLPEDWNKIGTEYKFVSMDNHSYYYAKNINSVKQFLLQDNDAVVDFNPEEFKEYIFNSGLNENLINAISDEIEDNRFDSDVKHYANFPYYFFLNEKGLFIKDVDLLSNDINFLYFNSFFTDDSIFLNVVSFDSLNDASSYNEESPNNSDRGGGMFNFGNKDQNGLNSWYNKLRPGNSTTDSRATATQLNRL